MNSYQFSKLCFTFNSIESIVPNVIKCHPYDDEIINNPDGDIIEQLLKKIEATPSSNLADLAKSLKRIEKIALLHTYYATEKNSIQNKIGIIAIENPHILYIKSAWRITLSHCDDHSFMHLLELLSAAILKTYTSEKLGESKTITDILSSKDIVLKLFQSLEESNSNFDLWIKQMDNSIAPIPPDSLLSTYIRIKLMTDGSKSLLTRHSGNQLLKWSKELRAPNFELFAINYLINIPFRIWEEDLIYNFVEKYGLPAKGHNFWENIPEDICLAIQRLIAGRMLSEFFKGVYDPQKRFIFWKNYIDKITEIQFPPRKEHVFLVFNNFGVVEFRERGNAAYFYEEKYFVWVRSRINLSSDCLKDQSTCFHRLIHNKHWQNGISNFLEKLFSSKQNKKNRYSNYVTPLKDTNTYEVISSKPIEWESKLLYWSKVKKRGYRYSYKKGAWWKKK